MQYLTVLLQSPLQNFLQSLVYVVQHHFAYKDILLFQIHLKMDSWSLGVVQLRL